MKAWKCTRRFWAMSVASAKSPSAWTCRARPRPRDRGRAAARPAWRRAPRKGRPCAPDWPRASCAAPPAGAAGRAAPDRGAGCRRRRGRRRSGSGSIAYLCIPRAVPDERPLGRADAQPVGPRLRSRPRDQQPRPEARPGARHGPRRLVEFQHRPASATKRTSVRPSGRSSATECTTRPPRPAAKATEAAMSVQGMPIWSCPAPRAGPGSGSARSARRPGRAGTGSARPRPRIPGWQAAVGRDVRIRTPPRARTCGQRRPGRARQGRGGRSFRARRPAPPPRPAGPGFPAEGRPRPPRPARTRRHRPASGRQRQGRAGTGQGRRARVLSGKPRAQKHEVTPPLEAEIPRAGGAWKIRFGLSLPNQLFTDRAHPAASLSEEWKGRHEVVPFPGPCGRLSWISVAIFFTVGVLTYVIESFGLNRMVEQTFDDSKLRTARVNATLTQDRFPKCPFGSMRKARSSTSSGMPSPTSPITAWWTRRSC